MHMFKANLFMIDVLIEILVFNLALQKFAMYKKLRKGVLKL